MIAEEGRADALWRTESQMLPVGRSPSGLVSWWNGRLLSKVTAKDISHSISRLPNCYTFRGQDRCPNWRWGLIHLGGGEVCLGCDGILSVVNFGQSTFG